MTQGLDALFDVHRAALEVREERQKRLASNLANANTPNYLAQDIDFKSALQSAVRTFSADSRTGGLFRTSTRHFPRAGGEGGGASVADFVRYRTPHQASLDGNTVDSSIEKTKFAENAMKYEASLTFLHHHFRRLSSILQG